MRLKSALLAAGLGLAIVPATHAATATGTLNLSITIIASCTVSAPTAINFGSVGSIPANIDQTSTFNVTCSNTTPYTISLGLGGGTGATVASRKMMSGANLVNYTLYRDAARTQVWGVTTGTDTVAGTGNGAAQAQTIYARVPAQATPALGTYNDAVTITVTY
ncbi:MAG: spore coat U domain-containing protein [Rhabdaerophilum sp.]